MKDKQSNQCDIDLKWSKILSLKSSLDYHEEVSKEIRKQIQELEKHYKTE